MEFCNNCKELLDYLCQELLFTSSIYCCGGHIVFQGEECEIGGIGGNIDYLLLLSPKYPMYLFSITEDRYDNNYFILSVFRGPSIHIDQTLGVKLPNYVKDELVATIEGKW